MKHRDFRVFDACRPIDSGSEADCGDIEGWYLHAPWLNWRRIVLDILEKAGYYFAIRDSIAEENQNAEENLVKLSRTCGLWLSRLETTEH